MYDLNRSAFTLNLIKNVAPAAVIGDEGLALVRELVGGEEVVRPSMANDRAGFVGFSGRDNADNATKVDVTNGVIPTGAPYIIQIPFGNLIATSYIVYDIINTIVTPASVDDASGLFTFNVGDAGKTVKIITRRNLTVLESRQYFYQRNINNQGAAILNIVNVLGGQGQIYTDKFVSSDDFTTGTKAYLGDNGLLASTGNIIAGEIIHLPSSDSPLLGIAFTIGNN